MCVCVCEPGPEDTSVVVCVCGWQRVCFVWEHVDVRVEWGAQVYECVPVGACSDLDIRPQLVHHRARHEGEKGGTTVLRRSLSDLLRAFSVKYRYARS